MIDAAYGNRRNISIIVNLISCSLYLFISTLVTSCYSVYSIMAALIIKLELLCTPLCNFTDVDCHFLTLTIIAKSHQTVSLLLSQVLIFQLNLLLNTKCLYSQKYSQINPLKIVYNLVKISLSISLWKSFYFWFYEKFFAKTFCEFYSTYRLKTYM